MKVIHVFEDIEKSQYHLSGVESGLAIAIVGIIILSLSSPP